MAANHTMLTAGRRQCSNLKNQNRRFLYYYLSPTKDFQPEDELKY